MLAKAMERVLVVGTGLTGAVTASLLKEQLPDTCNIQVWDKAAGAGGRMTTSRSPQNPECTVDLGAQYISPYPEEYQSHKSFYEQLEPKGLLEPLTGTIEGNREYPAETKHFVAPSGIGSVVKHFLHKFGAETKFGHQLSSLKKVDNSWQVSTQDGATETFDGVVLTMPVPQILALSGSMPTILEENVGVNEKLKAVSYSSRFALGLFYQPGVSLDVPWCAKYFMEDPCIRFVAIDNKKRGIDNPPAGPSVVVHCSVPFSLQHLEADKDSVCSEIVLPQVHKLLPQLPCPPAVKNHKWKYSQVHQGYAGSPGAVKLCERPLLVLGGDAFVAAPKFDGCLESATKIAEVVYQYNSDLTSNL